MLFTSGLSEETIFIFSKSQNNFLLKSLLTEKDVDGQRFISLQQDA